MASENLPPPDSASVPASRESAPGVPRQISSTELLAGEQEVLIHHHGEIYRLRVTRNGKLILQK